MSLGGREPLLLPRLPGTGGLRRGTGEDDIARLFCLSPGKNNSFGSARVARSAAFEVDTLKEWTGERGGKQRIDGDQGRRDSEQRRAVGRLAGLVAVANVRDYYEG